MTEKKWWQKPVPDKEPISKDKTEYYVVDKVTGKKHRMYLEDEYDLTEPKKKEEE